MRRCETSSRRETRLAARSTITLAVVLAVASVLACVPSVSATPFSDFEPSVDEMSWIDTYLLALAVNSSYRGQVRDFAGESFAEKFAHVYEPLGLRVIAFLDSGDETTGTQALVLRSEAIILVVFCGSEGHETSAAVRDWLTDAKVWPIEIEGTRIHRGFYYALESVWEDLVAAVAQPLSEGLELWFTGHSLGGALANLAAYRFHRQGNPVGGVYTFAAPKLGDHEFAAAFSGCLGERSQQWSTTLDPITRMPEITKRAAYEKLGVTNMVDASGNVELDTVQRMTRLPNPLAHRVTAYVNYLYRALPDAVRDKVPSPPPLCSSTTRDVGQHPENGWALCRDRIRKIGRVQCRESGGQVLDTWCLREDQGKYRYLAQKLKPKG